MVWTWFLWYGFRYTSRHGGGLSSPGVLTQRKIFGPQACERAELRSLDPCYSYACCFPDLFPSDSIQPEPFVQEVEIILLRYYYATVLCIPMVNDTPTYQYRPGILLSPLDIGLS
jgi:hypothetical protein